MEGVIEVQRRCHEEVDRLERAVVDELIGDAGGQKIRLMQELTASALLDQIGRTCHQLLALYRDDDGARAREIDAVTATTEFGDFYTRLKDIKDAHRRHPNERPVDDAEFDALVNSCRRSEEGTDWVRPAELAAEFDALFSGEEVHGKYFDLLLYYERYVNLRQVRKLDYLQYLQEFDNFEAIPAATKATHSYAKYLEEMVSYFEGFFRRAKPLFNIDGLRERETRRFEEQWAAAQIPGWESAAQREQVASTGIFCSPCARSFANEAVFHAHLAGKKHMRAVSSGHSGQVAEAEIAAAAAAAAADSDAVDRAPSKMSNSKCLALKEFLTGVYVQLLGGAREETRVNVERKQSRTYDEREEDVIVEQTVEPVEQAAEDQDDGRIYNPLNLPLDWDGKPIPFWLWKLHGLGVRFTCEICGNHVYMGKKAFDQHFFEWRHSNGMKALAIPNTKHFFQITKMDEALALWDKLKRASRTESFRPEAMEEFEDHLGNVYNRKTYEDLRRQGLI